MYGGIFNWHTNRSQTNNQITLFFLLQYVSNYCQSGWSRSNDPIIKSDVLYQLSYRLSCAAIGVTQFFNRGHTPRLKFVFSLQLFFTERMFLQYRWLYPTKNFAYMSPLNWFSAVAVPATNSSECASLTARACPSRTLGLSRSPMTKPAHYVFISYYRFSLFRKASRSRFLNSHLPAGLVQGIRPSAI